MHVPIILEVMANEEPKGDEEFGEEGPGASYVIFVSMESLSDKLKLLEYEKGYCRALHQKTISRHYYAIPTNPGEQFHSFSGLSAWLIRTAGGQMEQPHEYDDPNATIANILDEVRRLGHSVDFPPSKLKSGCGEQCVRVLDLLASAALKTRKFTYSMPRYPDETEEAEEALVVDDDAEWKGKGRADAFAGVGDQDLDEAEEDFAEDEGALDLDGLRRLRTSANRRSSTVEVDRSRPEEILESKVDSSEWQLEVERVLPQLKVVIRSEAKDWRAHVEQMHYNKTEIDKCYAQAKLHLGRLHDDLARSMEKISSREKYLNSQLEPLLNEFRAMQDQLSETKERYRQASGGITERSRLLAEITEELERVKQDMDERGSSMTDGSPVVKIKQAIQRLKTELVEMDIRTGVLEHMLLQGKLKAKTDTQRNQTVDDGYIY